jgi:hypothetical protein
MIDLDRILAAAVSVVSVGPLRTETPGTPENRGVSAVSAVSTRITPPEHRAEHPASGACGTARATCRTHRDKRDNRDTSKLAACAVSVLNPTTETTETSRIHRAWRVTLADGTRLVAVRPAGATRSQILEACADQFGPVTGIEPAEVARP